MRRRGIAADGVYVAELRRKEKYRHPLDDHWVKTALRSGSHKRCNAGRIAPTPAARSCFRSCSCVAVWPPSVFSSHLCTLLLCTPPMCSIPATDLKDYVGVEAAGPYFCRGTAVAITAFHYLSPPSVVVLPPPHHAAQSSDLERNQTARCPPSCSPLQPCLAMPCPALPSCHAMQHVVNTHVVAELMPYWDRYDEGVFIGALHSGSVLHVDQVGWSNIGKNWKGYKVLALWKYGAEVSPPSPHSRLMPHLSDAAVHSLATQNASTGRPTSADLRGTLHGNCRSRTLS